MAARAPYPIGVPPFPVGATAYSRLQGKRAWSFQQVEDRSTRGITSIDLLRVRPGGRRVGLVVSTLRHLPYRRRAALEAAVNYLPLSSYLLGI